MKKSSLAIAWSTGIAIFSMFFGSGNVVFPLLLGQVAQEQVSWALIGLSLTAVGGPLLGLLAAVLFAGNCKDFFYRIGVMPGYIFVLLILALLGPLGVMPRCFIVAHGAIASYLPQLSLGMFSVILGMGILLLLARRDFIIPILGYVLSPLLIITLVIIIMVALITPGAFAPTTHSPWWAFKEGLLVGYDTMDLFASIIFAVSIWLLLAEKLPASDKRPTSQAIIPIYVMASLIGGGLLGLIYVGLCFAAALHHEALIGVAPEQVLANLAIHLLGFKLAIVANVAVALACITTIMSLAVAVVDVIHVEINHTRLGTKIAFSYGWTMAATVAMTVLVTNLGFNNLMRFLHPIMTVCYPAIIVLTLCNIFYKLYGFKSVKIPFYLTLLGTFIWKIAN